MVDGDAGGLSGVGDGTKGAIGGLRQYQFRIRMIAGLRKVAVSMGGGDELRFPGRSVEV